MTPEQQAAIREEGARAVYLAEGRRYGENWSNALDATFSATVHDGDCTNKPYTCLLCEAEGARSSYDAAMAAHLKALEAAGYVLVPVEPTHEMVRAALNVEGLASLSEAIQTEYAAMLTARPR